MHRNTFLKTIALGSVSLGIIPSTLYAAITTEKDPVNDAVCKAVWKKLCGKLASKPYMTYVGPKKGLPNVLIYGDSISQDYTVTLRKKLDGMASVFRIFKNGGHSGSVVKFMKRLQQNMFQPHLKGGWNFEWDLIQFNVGLHDLKYLNGRTYDVDNGTQVTSPKQYKENLKEIITYFKKENPKAKLIYVLTTPVPKGARGRKEGDALVFNKAALEVLSEYPEITINDLYAFTKPNFSSWAKGPGNVHYNEQGTQAQGKEVARIIKKYL